MSVRLFLPCSPPFPPYSTNVRLVQFIPLNPRPMLQGLVNKDVIVRIKWGQEYSGKLVSVDSYMNIQLSGAEEKSANGTDNGVLGQVLIR